MTKNGTIEKEWTESEVDQQHILLLVETSLTYGREIIRGVGRYAMTHSEWSMYLDLRELDAEPPEWIDNWDGDGIIIRSTTPELAKKLKKKTIPVVDLSDIYGDLGLQHVWTNQDKVGELAAQHLLERGFTNFAFCGFSGHKWSLERAAGFERCIEEKNSANTYDYFETPWGTTKSKTWERQQKEIAEWLLSLKKPVGVFCCNDMRGQHVLDACRRLKLAVPEEVAVIGVDNDELLCDLCYPPMTSVIPNAEKVGYEAACLMNRLMQGEQIEERIQYIDPIGIAVRQSTDVLAITDTLVVEALRLIRQNACLGITVSQVLKHVPLSRSVLERRFRKYLGRSPQEEIRYVQIRKVKQLLAETDLAMDRIADLAGYAHPEYMNVVFKRETSETPGQYRKRTKVK